MALPFGEAGRIEPHFAPAASAHERERETKRHMQPSGFAQATMSFLLSLREKGVGNIDILRALETVPRDLFVPHRFMDLAWRDMSLPIACGQTMPPPMLVARMLEAAQIAPQHRVLEIGTGSGYTSAVLARLCAELISVERFQILATEAHARLATMALAHAHVLWDDGLQLSHHVGSFDRIIIHGLVSDVPAHLLSLLNNDGMLIAAAYPKSSPHADGEGEARPKPQLMRCVMSSASPETSFLGPCPLPPLIAGRSVTL